MPPAPAPRRGPASPDPRIAPIKGGRTNAQARRGGGGGNGRVSGGVAEAGRTGAREAREALLDKVKDHRLLQAQLQQRLEDAAISLEKLATQAAQRRTAGAMHHDDSRQNGVGCIVEGKEAAVVMVGAECAPYSKTGGLGDVMGALPKALAKRGHRVMVVTPRYADYKSARPTQVRGTYSIFGMNHEVHYYHELKDGVHVVFVDHPSYHNRGSDIYSGSRLDVAFRCALLSKCALEAPRCVPCGDSPFGTDNLTFVANDWHAALTPLYLEAHYRDRGEMACARSVLVLHNIAYQGRGPMAELGYFGMPWHYSESFRLYDPVGGEHMNVMKAAIIHSHSIVAVSRGYAWECKTQEGGWGLHGVLQEQDSKLRGIVNGIDTSEWNPATDAFLTSGGYARYGPRSVLAGKAACKAALQGEMGLPAEAGTPMLGFVGRLDHQKGVDLIYENFEWLMGRGVQLVMLGSGNAELESALVDMERRRPRQCRAWVGFSVEMAHKITAAADVLLMPSRFEPCGLNQMYAMAYGTVPVAHRVGGLRDTITHYDSAADEGTGWLFDSADAGALRGAVDAALEVFCSRPEAFRRMQRRGMAQDLSWDRVAVEYEEVIVGGSGL
eukprot:evm.model.scf_662.3 EVM.evm.TU.scf_662.3   scf_662:24974-40282(-)